MPSPRAILLDFYGTLAHSPGFDFRKSAALMAQSLREDGVAVTDAEFTTAYRRALRPYLDVMRSGRETHNTSWVADAVSELGTPIGAGDRRVVEAVRRYFAAYAAAIEPLPGAEAALPELAGRHVLVLVSNFTDATPVRATIERLGWDRHLGGTVVSAEVGWRKPHPEIFRRALAIAGCRPSEALHVGDDLREDVGGARAAGIPAVHVAGADGPMLKLIEPEPGEESVEPDYTIPTIADLRGLLDE